MNEKYVMSLLAPRRRERGRERSISVPTNGGDQAALSGINLTSHTHTHTIYTHGQRELEKRLAKAQEWQSDENDNRVGEH